MRWYLTAPTGEARIRYRRADAGACRVARLAESVLADPTVAELHQPLALILDQGPLAERLIRALAGRPTRAGLRDRYERLCACVEEGEPFRV